MVGGKAEGHLAMQGHSHRACSGGSNSLGAWTSHGMKPFTVQQSGGKRLCQLQASACTTSVHASAEGPPPTLSHAIQALHAQPWC